MMKMFIVLVFVWLLIGFVATSIVLLSELKEKSLEECYRSFDDDDVMVYLTLIAGGGISIIIVVFCLIVESLSKNRYKIIEFLWRIVNKEKKKGTDHYAD